MSENQINTWVNRQIATLEAEFLCSDMTDAQYDRRLHLIGYSAAQARIAGEVV